MLSVELHCHTHASDDCLLRPADIIRVCRERGIDRLAVTDHNTLRGAHEMQALAPELVIVGEEIMTTRGELLGYFVREMVPPGLTPAETIARLRAQGAAISVSHPFDRHRAGAWHEPDLLAIAPLVDAIEVFNARALHRADNDRAADFARAHGLRGTVGSDAHSLRELGRARMFMPATATPADLIAGWALSRVETRLSAAAIHLTSRWAKLVKRVRRQQRPGG